MTWLEEAHEAWCDEQARKEARAVDQVAGAMYAALEDVVSDEAQRREEAGW